MSTIALAFPAQAAIPVAQAFISNVFSAIRPLVGLSAFVAFIMLFKPLLMGVVHAVLLVFKPRHSLEERQRRHNLRGVLMLNRMAKDFDVSQPNLAAELRLLASRG